MILEDDLNLAMEEFIVRLRSLCNIALREVFRIKLRGP